MIRGMNHVKTLTIRQELTSSIRDGYLYKLKIEGYNPITDKCNPPPPEEDNDYEIHPECPLVEAINKAFEKFEGESKTDLRGSLKYIKKSIVDLKYQDWPVSKVRRRHLTRILENCEKIKRREKLVWTNNQFNHYRTALNSIYKIFVKCETVDANPIHAIEKKQHAPEPRHVLTLEQRKLINYRLKINNFRFWNFIHLFFHSGARLTEMSRIKGKHVNIERQIATFLVKKGKNWAWIDRPISDEALPFWQRALAGCGPEQFVFSKGLLPGDVQIRSNQYTRRWHTWIIKPVADEDTKFHPRTQNRINWMSVKLYDLKHTRTTEIRDMLDDELRQTAEIAAKANGHTTIKMVEGVYDVKNRSRKDDKIKKLPIRFA